MRTELVSAGAHAPQLADPPSLRAAWAALRTAEPHLHGPAAAARLGVSEAALIASRVGDGATPLTPDLAQLLAGCDGWGKLLLAARCGLGAAIGALDAPVARFGAGRLVIEASQVSAHVDLGAAVSVFLFEDDDDHGHTLSLNWFDGAGDALGRVFLMSKSRRAEVASRLRALALPGDAAPWQPQPSAPSPGVLQLAPHCEPLAQLDSLSPAEVGTRALLARDAAPEWRVVLEGPGVALRYQGRLARSHVTPGAIHATDVLCKLHLRMHRAVAAWRCVTADGHAALQWIDAEGGRLTLAALGTDVDWIDALLTGDCA